MRIDRFDGQMHSIIHLHFNRSIIKTEKEANKNKNY